MANTNVLKNYLWMLDSSKFGNVTFRFYEIRIVKKESGSEAA